MLFSLSLFTSALAPAPAAAWAPNDLTTMNILGDAQTETTAEKEEEEGALAKETICLLAKVAAATAGSLKRRLDAIFVDFAREFRSQKW